GTSWSAPTWAGFAALINQARAQSGQSSLGLLNSRIYPLVGTSNFHDITSGSDGAYSAGANYDLVTGLGTPDVNVLVQSLAGSGNGAPVISSFSPNVGVPGTSVSISGAN